jgi:hypothetical protein
MKLVRMIKVCSNEAYSKVCIGKHLSDNFRTLKNKHEIRSFLGLCTYYRWVISGFANIAKLLTKLNEEKQAFQWTPDVQAAFQTLKWLCTTPVLAYPQPRERFIVT